MDPLLHARADFPEADVEVDGHGVAVVDRGRVRGERDGGRGLVEAPEVRRGLRRGDGLDGVHPQVGHHRRDQAAGIKQ